MPMLRCAGPDEMEGVIENVMGGGIGVTSRMRLSCRLSGGQNPLLFAGHEQHQILNELVIQGNAVRLTAIDCYLNNKYLARSTGDGMIAATATGSTAYSYACGGSAVHPALQAILVTPIATRTLPFRPLIMPPGSTTLKLRLSEDSRDEANVWIDGQRCYKLPRGAHVEISASPYPIVTIGKGDGIDDWSRALKRMTEFVENEYVGTQ